jgi:hypothetical protein
LELCIKRFECRVDAYELNSAVDSSDEDGDQNCFHPFIIQRGSREYLPKRVVTPTMPAIYPLDTRCKGWFNKVMEQIISFTELEQRIGRQAATEYMKEQNKPITEDQYIQELLEEEYV